MWFILTSRARHTRKVCLNLYMATNNATLGADNQPRQTLQSEGGFELSANLALV